MSKEWIWMTEVEKKSFYNKASWLLNQGFQRDIEELAKEIYEKSLK